MFKMSAFDLPTAHMNYLVVLVVNCWINDVLFSTGHDSLISCWSSSSGVVHVLCD